MSLASPINSPGSGEVPLVPEDPLVPLVPGIPLVPDPPWININSGDSFSPWETREVPVSPIGIKISSPKLFIIGIELIWGSIIFSRFSFFSVKLLYNYKKIL
jgi:hypothetical protein